MNVQISGAKVLKALKAVFRGGRGEKGRLVKMQTCDSYCPEAELPVTDTCIVCGRVGCGVGMDF